METYIERYARLIIDVQLKLVEGDNLSINTEARTMGFARYLAHEAVITTRLPVMIVETEGGKVIQAYPIEPQQKDLLRPQVGQAVMCHIVDLDNHPYDEDEDLGQIVKDAASLSRYGALADPVFLDRRIAAPWANIPYPGLRWASAQRGERVGEEEAWRLFATIMRLDSEWTHSFWQEQANVLTWRKQRLDALGNSKVSLFGDLWSLTGTLAANTHFCGGSSILASGRSFIPTLPIQCLDGSFATETVNGTFASSHPFYVLGKRVEGATFTIEAGKVTSWHARQGSEALSSYFAIDEGAAHISSLILADTNTLESRYLTAGLHPHFTANIDSAIAFGGFTIESLDRGVDEESLSQCRLNESLVRLVIPIGSAHLSVHFEAEGDVICLMEEGVFNE